MSRTNWAVAACVLSVMPACAGCGPRAGIDPLADEALKKMSNALGSAEAFSFRAAGTMDEVLETGQLTQISRTSRALARRPNKLFVDTAGDDVSRSAWYDGRTVTVLDKSANIYATIPAPSSIEEMLDFVIEKYGLTIPVADLLFSNSYESLVANVESGTYIGRHSVGGRACHHLLFTQENIDWQIWIDAGEEPVPRKLLIVHKHEPGHPRYSVEFDEWNLSARAPGDKLEPALPPDAKQVKMTELLGIEEGE